MSQIYFPCVFLVVRLLKLTAKFALMSICAIFRVEGGLKRSWPKNLSVRSLEVNGSLSLSDIENLSSIECELKLNLDCVAADQMYQLLERIGQFVKVLDIGEMICRIRSGIVYIKSEIILERILAACPNLESLGFNTRRMVVQDKKYNLPPSAFKNYKKYFIKIAIIKFCYCITLSMKVWNSNG